MLVFGVKNRYVRMNVNYHKKNSKNIGTYICFVDKRAYILIWASNAKN